MTRHHLTRCPCPARCAPPINLYRSCLFDVPDPEAIKTLSRVSTPPSPRSSSKRACERLDAGLATAAAGTTAAGRAGIYAAFRARAGGSGDAGIMVVADFDRTAIEAMPEGCIAVVDAMGVTDAGIFGDILCARMAKRGVAALVTDGVVRDLEGVLAPACRCGVTASRSTLGRRADIRRLGRNRSAARRCGVSERHHRRDQDGAVVIPQAFLDLILAEGAEQERMEAWIVEQVNGGAVLPGLYPMNAETKARYAASKK